MTYAVTFRVKVDTDARRRSRRQRRRRRRRRRGGEGERRMRRFTVGEVLALSNPLPSRATGPGWL